MQELLPYLTVLTCNDTEYVCLVANSDDKIITFYDLAKIVTEVDKKEILELADVWWWNSNRMLPPNIFLPTQFIKFRYCLTTLTTKDVEVISGPCVSLENIKKMKSKRKNIQLIRKYR